MRYRVFMHNVPEEIEAPDKTAAEAALLELLPKSFWLLHVAEEKPYTPRSPEVE